MSKQPPRPLVDKSTYEQMVDSCLNEVEELGEISSDYSPPAAAATATPQTKHTPPKFNLLRQRWFQALAVLCLISIGMFSFSKFSSEPATSADHARQELQAKLGKQFPAVDSMLNFLESDTKYYGPNDPEFKQSLTKLNNSLATADSEEDFKPLNPEFFQFRGSELVYVEKKTTPEPLTD